MGFDHDAGTPVSCMRQIHSKCPKEHQARPENYCSLPSEGSRSHGSCIHGDTLGPPADEIVSVVAQSQGISSKSQSPEANNGYAPGASYPFYVVQTPVSDICPDRPAPGSPGQGPSTGVSPLTVSAPLADQNMVQWYSGQYFIPGPSSGTFMSGP